MNEKVQQQIADLRHNMSDLKDGTLKDKYQLAEYILRTAILDQRYTN